MKNMQDKTRALATASQGGQLDAIRPAFVAAAESCKACHDQFKAD
jgi:cytochrome c556